ncbi:YsnF/AvaK domain-containing protein [Bacillus sp. SCS-153A]|uniref:YsnF/AvaK domain-containing protein n=1 Tax=Rossellomorea sedimentorum TaxID=3115294 RepID=UPI003906A537
MEKHIIGAYDSTNEAAAVVEQLSRKGYSPEEILVVSNRDQLGSLENKTGLQVEHHNGTESHDESMWDKIKEAFTLDEEDHSENRLSKYGLSDAEAKSYESELHDGKILIAVEGDSRVEMENDKAGFSRPDTGGEDYTADWTTDTTEEQSMELREERLNVDKEEVKTGEVSIGKEVVEEKRSVDVPVKHEEVYVEKRHVQDGEMRNTSAELGEDEEIRIPVVEERVEVKKKPVVTDEVVVGKRTTEETEHISDTVKKEEVHLNKNGSSKVQGEDKLDHQAANGTYATGQEGLTDTAGMGSEKERRDYKNSENADEVDSRRNDYRGDI